MDPGRSFLFFTIIGLSVFTGCSKPDLNLGFERADPTGTSPLGWDITYDLTGSDRKSVRLDTLHVRSGKYSLRVDEGRCTYVLPATYRGDSVDLRGFFKTTSPSETSSRGFWLSTSDGEGELHSLYTLNNRITSDGKWNEYSLKIPLHPYAKEIVFGTYFYGSGNAWADDLRLFIDGRPIHRTRPVKIRDYPALLDSSYHSGSGISIGSIGPRLLESLTLMCRTWGFVKYYHPQVATGNHNMDAEFFRLLPGILGAGEPEEVQGILVDWIRGLGDITPCGNCKVEIEGDHALLPDLAWIDDVSVGEELRTALLQILKNRNQEPHFYVGVNPGIGNPVFKHEYPYQEFPYPDDGLRLLSLFRYWNIIQYFFPYRDLIGENWSDVLREYLPVFLDAGNELEYRLALLHLTGRIHDSHAAFPGNDSILNNYRGLYHAPIRVGFVENQAVVIGYYNRGLGSWSGLELGDVILEIDGKPVDAIINERKGYYPASNQAAWLRDIGRDLLRGLDGSVKIKYRRKGQPAKTTISRYPAEHIDRSGDFTVSRPDSCYYMLTGWIGYISLGNIKNEYLPDIFNHFRHTKGIIIDIRNYPSEFVVFTLGKYLMPEPREFVKFTIPDITYPGLFRWTDPPEVGEHNPDYYKGKIVILVNEITQSQAEYTAMAYRKAPSALVVGSKTAGANGNVSGILLPGNFSTMISGIGVYHPDGTGTQRIGIVPDVEFRPTLQGIVNGRDEILERAIELIENDDI